MGYIRHHAIIVTSWKDEVIETAHDRAVATFGCGRVSEILDPKMNLYRTFLIGPDGSKEGWEESDLGDQQRDAFLESIKDFEHEDGSSPLAWVEVQYGDDDHQQRVVRASNFTGGSR